MVSSRLPTFRFMGTPARAVTVAQTQTPDATSAMGPAASVGNNDAEMPLARSAGVGDSFVAILQYVHAIPDTVSRGPPTTVNTATIPATARTRRNRRVPLRDLLAVASGVEQGFASNIPTRRTVAISGSAGDGALRSSGASLLPSGDRRMRSRVSRDAGWGAQQCGHHPKAYHPGSISDTIRKKTPIKMTPPAMIKNTAPSL